jgi:hypothetical protein
MSTIIQQPDSLSFSRNLKKFVISSTEQVSYILGRGSEQILNEIYFPGTGDLVEIDLTDVIDRLLSISLPTNSLKDQTTGYSDFMANIDGVLVGFRVVKGGVKGLGVTAESWFNTHWLSWQIQDKRILQIQPEWLTLYTNATRIVKVKAYFLDKTDETITLQTLTDTGKLYAIDVSWAVINEALVKKNPVIWEVWFEDTTGTRLSYFQRYVLRNQGEEENLFIWQNTVGGIDSVSFTGYNNDDKKLEHQLVETFDQSFEEYYIDFRKREIRQSAGYLTKAEARWIDDFFLSKKRYRVEPDGSVNAIVFIESTNDKESIADMVDGYEFTYRYASDSDLLNLDRNFDLLPAMEVPDDFFLTELLSGLASAQYSDTLLLAVQNPHSIGWKKLSLAELFAGAMPALVDGTTIIFSNGKLSATNLAALPLDALQQLKDYIDYLSAQNNGSSNDSSTAWIDGSVLWQYGLTYDSTVIHYKMMGVKMSANAKEVTLEAADPTLQRIDLFYVDQFGNFGVKTGIPGSGLPPDLVATELQIGDPVVIPAAATQPSGIAIQKVYDEHVTGEWTAAKTNDDHVTVDFESTDTPAVGSKYIKVGIAIPDTVPAAPLHFKGEKYQGGVIFYLSPDGKSGLISAINDANTLPVYWESLSGHSVYETGASGIIIGAGPSNTALMLDNAAARDFAVKYCDNLVIDGFDDWFMPSEKELAEMWFNRNEICNFADKTYWSSTEVTGTSNWQKARCIAFSTGAAYTRDKNNSYWVRAIRAFDDTTIAANQPVLNFAPVNTKMTFTYTTPLPVVNGILSIKLRSLLPWLGNTKLLIESFIGSTKTGQVVLSPAGNMFGYNSSDEAWQSVAIQLKSFNASRDTLDSFRISLVGSWPNNNDLGLDDIRFQVTTVQPTVNTKILVSNEPVVETPNGILTLFTTVKPFKPGTYILYANGIREQKGITWNEENGKVRTLFVPGIGEKLSGDYEVL